MQFNKSTICQGCDEPFSANILSRLPKHLHCGHTFCLECLHSPGCLSQSGHAVVCRKCRTTTPLAVHGDCCNSLVTNFHVLMSISSSSSPLASSYSSGGNNNFVSSGAGGADSLAKIPDCESPGCAYKAAGRCRGCADAGYCNQCFAAHIERLPLSVRGRHTLGSASDSTVCEIHRLPRQLFCKTHSKAICPTCAQLHHRDAPCEIHELRSVVDALKPQIEKRKEKMTALFEASLGSCYQIEKEMQNLNKETEQTISALCEDAAACVERVYATIFSVQEAALDRQAQLQNALVSISTEAGDFAEEVDEIRDLFSSISNDDGDGGGGTTTPDPNRIARHAPAEVPAIRTIIPHGDTLEAKLHFEIKTDWYRHWLRRGASVAPQQWGGATIDSKKSNIITPMKFTFGSSQGTAPDQFNHPGGMAVLPNDNVVVCDTYNHRLQILEASSGKFIGLVRLWRSGHPDQQQQQHHHQSPTALPGVPSHVTVLRNGLLLVIDVENRCTYFVDPDRLVQLIPKFASASAAADGTTASSSSSTSASAQWPPRWQLPTGVCLLPWSDEVAIIDKNRHLVSVLRNSTSVLNSFVSSNKKYRTGSDGGGGGSGAVVAREFDGVDTTRMVVLEQDEHQQQQQQHQHHPHGHAAISKVHEDVVHRVTAPTAMCVVPAPGGVFRRTDISEDDNEVAPSSAHSSPSPSAAAGVDAAAALQHRSASSTSQQQDNIASRSVSQQQQQRQQQVTIPPQQLNRSQSPSSPSSSPNNNNNNRNNNNKDMTGTIQTKPVRRDHPSHENFLVAICSEKYVALFDARTGAFVRFVGGDASAKRPFGRPWGIASSCDGQRLAIVDAAHSCIFVCQVSDGAVLGRINVDSKIYPQHAVVLPTTGQIVVTDCVNHTVNVLDAVL